MTDEIIPLLKIKLRYSKQSPITKPLKATVQAAMDGLSMA